MQLPNKVYDVLKWIGLIVLPALGTLYATLGAAWGFPYIEPIKTTCLALSAFIGAVIGVSTSAYNKAVTNADESTTNK